MSAKRGAKVNAHKLAKRNPGVNLRKLDEAQVALEGLKAIGVARHSYDLSIPYERRPVLRKDTRASR